MPLYEDENTTIADLNKIRKKSLCSVCGARLNIYLDPESGRAFLACWDWLRTHHDGIERKAGRYEKDKANDLMQGEADDLIARIQGGEGL